MQTQRQIQELLASAGVAPNRRLGQHFLVDLNLMRLLVDSAQIGPRDVVLEVGAGTGSLTEALAERAGQVVSVELDRTLAGIARSQLAGAENVQLVDSDVLSGKGTLHPAVVEGLERARTRIGGKGPQGPQGPKGLMDEGVTGLPGGVGGRLLLVANLPYDVASPVMINLVKGPVTADAMTVTVQKEVAERMTAAPGGKSYGTLSIFLGATGTVETLRVLRPSVFWPPPNVDSAIVRYVRDEQRSRCIRDMDLFSRVVGLFIGHRRKMLRACAKQAPADLCGPACRGHPARDARAGRVPTRDESRLGSHEGSRDWWPEIFAQCAIDPTRRPEELAPDQYVALANTCRQLLPRP